MLGLIRNIILIAVLSAPNLSIADEKEEFLKKLCSEGPQVLEQIKVRVETLASAKGDEINKRIDIALAQYLVALYYSIEDDYKKHCH